MTALSRLLGLLRDVSFAIFIGAGANADAFFIAFKIPNFLRRLFAEGAFSQAFVPVLAEHREREERTGQPQVQALVDRVAGGLAGVLLAVTSLAVVAAPLVAALFAPGFVSQPYKFALVVDLIRICFPYLLLISLTGFAGAVLNSYGRFAVPAFTPVLLNLCLIGAAWWGGRQGEEPAYALAWGVLLAGLCQLLFQLPSMHYLGRLPRLRWDWQHPGVRQVITLMLPALFGVSVAQINLLLDTVLASFLPTGSVSWLYFSDRLVELPLGVFAIAIATVALPSLSRHSARDSGAAFSATLDWALRLVLMIALPATVALLIMAEPILITLFQYRETLPRDVHMASFSLMAYTLGLTAFMLIKVLAPGFYARKDTRTPVRIGVIAMVANMVLNLVFVLPLHAWLQLGHAGLALATATSAWLNAGLLWRGLHREGAWQPGPGWRRFWLQLGLATALMAVLLAWWLPPAAHWLALDWLQRTLGLLALCGAGGLLYVATLVATGLRMGDLRGQGSSL